MDLREKSLFSVLIATSSGVREEKKREKMSNQRICFITLDYTGVRSPDSRYGNQFFLFPVNGILNLET
jgi:hypothetical protein